MPLPPADVANAKDATFFKQKMRRNYLRRYRRTLQESEKIKFSVPIFSAPLKAGLSSPCVIGEGGGDYSKHLPDVGKTLNESSHIAFLAFLRERKAFALDWLNNETFLTPPAVIVRVSDAHFFLRGAQNNHAPHGSGKNNHIVRHCDSSNMKTLSCELFLCSS